MDAFYAAIEQRDNPDLRGKPVLVGSPSGRGVVTTASYEARPFKVGSAMPMAEALRRCPNAIVVAPRFARYEAVSRHIMALFSDMSPAVEALSLDEAFIDLTGTEAVHGGPLAAATALKRAVRKQTGLVVSVGVSGTKYVAKVASDYGKPGRLAYRFARGRGGVLGTVAGASSVGRWAQDGPAASRVRISDDRPDRTGRSARDLRPSG